MCELEALLHSVFERNLGVSFILNADAEYECTISGLPTPRGSITFLRYGPTPELALASALDHADELSRNPSLTPPATDLLTLLGIQPAAKPKPNFTGTIRRI